ncbi:netrin-A-like [Uranotaenia lowii]|uniref:netrin-A-like n=1 Tax=Uranotaenia lowii TaxID=190385 RepID=UPI00247A4B8D|nr:netrin-A-like [Uranotaenia lowii]
MRAGGVGVWKFIVALLSRNFSMEGFPEPARINHVMKTTDSECGKCKIGTKRLNLNKFCKRDYVIMAKVIARDTNTASESTKSNTNTNNPYGSSSSNNNNNNNSIRKSNSNSNNNNEVAKFTLSIQKVFKRSPNQSSPLAVALRRSSQQHVALVVGVRDLECRCPKVKVNRSYLILGRDTEGPPGALGIGPRSIVIEWRDEWHRRLRKFQRQAAETCQ